LQQEYPLIDGHNDLPWEIRKKANDSVWQIDLNHQPTGQTDIARLRKGLFIITACPLHCSFFHRPIL
jgi:hypothetical protein